MSQPSTIARLTFTDAVDPESGKHVRTVIVTEKRALEIERRGELAVVEMYEFVGRTLVAPSRVYRGVRGKDDSWNCYVACHDQRYLGKMMPSLPEMAGDLFLVFVNDDGVAYTWRWEKPDPEKPGCPKDADIRFGEEVL